MESLNMNNLAHSLPSSTVANAEKDLMDKFKAAAMSVTTLYRTSMAANKQHYNAGYSAALRDLMEVIQQGVSVGHLGGESGNEAEGGMTIGRVMDWIDARLDAIKAMGEDEDDDERDKESGTKAKVGGSNRISAADRGDKQRSYPSTSSASALPTPRSPNRQNQQTAAPHLATPSSPSPPPCPTATPTRSSVRIKSRAAAIAAKEQTSVVSTSNSASTELSPASSSSSIVLSQTSNVNSSNTAASTAPVPTFNFNTLPPSDSRSTYPFPDHDAPLVTEVVPLSPIIGMKRRHMATLDGHNHLSGMGMGVGLGSEAANTLSAVPGASTPRRRTKSSRSQGLSSVHPHSHSYQGRPNSVSENQDAMMMVDVEEEGRERKRVARR